jgi:hypothetical protein
MTLYRALLRAMENTAEDFHTDANYAGRIAVLAGAKECAKEAVEFAEDLRNRGSAGVWDAFWHSCKSMTSITQFHLHTHMLTLH